MTDLPFSFTIPLPGVIPSHYDSHLERRLSSMRGQYLDQVSYQRMLAVEDTLLYEVYEVKRPAVAGELLLGISIVHPGKVGNEFFMTKGHFHAVLETSEVYYCLKGEGFMVMEDPQGETAIEPLAPGKVLYVPPCWAHRSVCTARQEDLVTFFIYPANAGHDYGTIERQGFRKLVVDGGNGIQIIDNPRWSPVGN
jgi:glucose-6-phosphate isomerase, archaeal